jgi:hypothetical protein
VLELLAVVPFLCAVSALFHELAHSKLLHDMAPGAIPVALGASKLIVLGFSQNTGKTDSTSHYFLLIPFL